MNQLSKMVAEMCARSLSQPIGDWLLKNHMPVIVEPKYDGRRVWAIVSGAAVVLATKHNGIYTKEMYPQLFAKMPNFGGKLMILDCEFLVKQNKLAVFDVVNYDGKFIFAKPLVERKKILAGLDFGKDNETVFPVPHVYASNIAEVDQLFRCFTEQKFEGIMIKNPDSKYDDAGAWLKMKKFDTLDVFVTGIGEDTEGFSWHIAGFTQGGQQVNLGKVGSFVKEVDATKIGPGTVVEVRYQEITKENNLRHPFIVRIRDDKIAKECIVDVRPKEVPA